MTRNIEEELRELRSKVDGIMPAPQSAHRLVRRAKIQRLLAGSLSVAALLAATGGAITLAGRLTEPNSGPPAAASSNERPSDSNIQVRPQTTAKILVGPSPQAITAGQGAIWAALPNQDGTVGGAVVRIDPSTNEIEAKIPIEIVPRDIGAGSGGVWVAGQRQNRGMMLRIDPKLNAVAASTIFGDGKLPVGLAVVDDAVWTSISDSEGESGSVVRVNPQTNQIEADIPLSGLPGDIVVGEGGVWVLELQVVKDTVGDATVVEIDPATNQRLSAIALNGTSMSLVAGRGSVWVQENGYSLVRINPQSGEAETIATDVPLGINVFGLGQEGLWFTGVNLKTNRDEIGLFDVENRQVEASVSLESEVVDAVFDPTTRSIWVTDAVDSVIRIDVR